MKQITAIISRGAVAALLAAVAIPTVSAAEVEGWGDFKLFIDPGHSMRENQGMWGYSEAQKTLRVALGIKNYLETYTDMPTSAIKLCRYDDNTSVSLEERSDMANAWGADFFYSIHSDAGATVNSTVLLFGGWRKNGVEIEKTPNGGKAYGEFLDPNLAGAMRISSRGNWYDRCFYDRAPETHTNQYPYLSVNRRSHMPSLLSEGGYHTIQSQQRLNINDDYKKLESLAAFHAILQYRGLNLPATTALTGIVYNGENNEPINGVKVTVDGRTYTTNTWEDTFREYTNNPDLIQNGFYLFEGLTAGETYDVTFEREGYEPLTTQATIKAGGTTTPDFLTFLDVNMTNIAPARVATINLENLDAVTPIKPLRITFSRAMDRESVEEAFSINPAHPVTLTWKNDYTLEVDLSQLYAEWIYAITIDGSVAKNSATGQLLDGDGDGVEGGNYVLNFAMAEEDNEAPYIINTTPATDGEAIFTNRPVIGIEFNEQIAWNDDNHSDFVTVTDADGTIYPGRVTHAVILGKSFLQYYLDEDLPRDRAFLVSIKAGLEDLFGNAADALYFRFLSEYREQTSYTNIYEFNSLGNWWKPGGSGSSLGIDKENCDIKLSKITSSTDPSNTGSMEMIYIFDMGASAPTWCIREYWKDGLNYPINDIEGRVITAWVYGDASNNTIGIRGRVQSKTGGIKMRDPEFPIDWRGWRLIYWDFSNDGWDSFTGTQNLMAPFYFDSFFMTHLDIDPDDEEIPYQEWEGSVLFDNLGYSTWDDKNFARTANVEDIAIPSSGVQTIAALRGVITFDGQVARVISNASTCSMAVYSAAGQLVAKTRGARINLSHLAHGVYVVKAETSEGAIVAKVVK